MKRKVITKKEQFEQQQATVIGGAKGFLGGLAVAVPASYFLQKRWAYYRALPSSLKALGVVMVVVPSCVISAERAGLRFEREQWTGIDKQELATIAAREQERWDKMTFGQKASEVAVRNEYGLIGGAWALTMAGAFGTIMRNPYQTLPQKIVQARMWAQGLTIGVLIAAGALTHSRRARATQEGVDRHLAADHSWRDIIQQEQDDARAGANNRS
ncbi:hypothetical protein NLI96_g2641 [Meripilus lineatus]|uniref:HIG1 domain-containing protein n=1 Tax=Meripilus lineatus TaxID=2056292 RepID=A0AAD5YLP0_9APHY|nr:hypothetical protein NLI96_g2641 [Physisporinus lineatus]